MHRSTKIVERTQFEELKSHLKEKEMTVLLGARQVGKTTLMQMLRKHLIEKENVLPENAPYFNLDVMTDLEFFQSQARFINFLRERTENGNFLYVFIDEVQRIENPGIFLKGVYDLALSVKFVVSGSSALEIKRSMQESLTGRKKVFQIRPFSFEEFLNHKDKSLKKVAFEFGELLAEEKYKLDKCFEEFLLFGGYPRVVTSERRERKIELLQEIFNSYVEKDVVQFLAVKNPLAFSSLVRMLSAQNGGIVNVSKLSDSLNLNQRTVEKYLYFLEQTFVVKKLPPFFTNAGKEIVKMPKIYFVDLGLRNFAISDFSSLKDRQDKGLLLENFVHNEFKQRFGLTARMNFWRNKEGREVDFVIRKDGKTIPLEVKTKKGGAKTTLGLRNFMRQYDLEKGFVLVAEGDAEDEQMGKFSTSFRQVHRAGKMEF